MREVSSGPHVQLNDERHDATREGTSVTRTGRRLALPVLGIRIRILLGFLAVLVVATIGSVIVARALVVADIDERISEELVQEAGELRRLASGRDPVTGEPFGGDVRRIFDVYLGRNVASPNEALLTFVNGQPYRRSQPLDNYRLDRDPELVRGWTSLVETERGRVNGTPAGDIEYLAVPVLDGGRPAGVFVVAVFRDGEETGLERLTLATGGVGLAVVLVGSLLVWWLADRILRRVQLATRTARSITETDLVRRIPVKGNDEVAELSRTFNEMLDRLDTAFEAQRRFLDDASHELRTPITIVRGHLELLGDDPVEREETVALATDELDRMARLVDDLLTLAKAKRLDFLQREHVALDSFADELVAKASALADRLWVVDSQAAGEILADRQRLTQAVMQLAENAARHTAVGDEIGIGVATPDGAVRIWVRDTGPGVPPGHERRIFERLVRGPGRPRHESSGLGLAIVSAIAEAHEGTVELSSPASGGATFTIVLPRLLR